MPFNTRNPIPSGDLRDLDDNARNIDVWANDKTKLSHPDRFGVERYTWHGIEQDAQAVLDSAEAIRDNLGFFPPIDYASGLSVETTNFTVNHEGVVYAAQPSAVPFTTGAWDAQQWYPLQNIYSDHNLLVFESFAEASAAAATLPDGQVVASEYDQSLYDVLSGELANERPVSQVNDYSKVKSYTGRGTRLRVKDSTGTYWWERDDGVVTENVGTTLLDALGRGWRRSNISKVHIDWFIESGATTHTTALKSAIETARSLDKVLHGTSGAEYITTETLVFGGVGKKFVEFHGNYCTLRVQSASNIYAIDLSGTSSAYTICGTIKELFIKNTTSNPMIATSGGILSNYTGQLSLENVKIETHGSCIDGIEKISHKYTGCFFTGTNSRAKFGVRGQARNQTMIGGRIYACEISQQLHGDSYLFAGVNFEFNSIIFWKRALGAARIEGCHFETSSCLLTNADNLPANLNTSSEWEDTSGGGVGGGPVTFANCFCAMSGALCPIIVLKTQTGYTDHIEFDGCSIIHGTNKFATNFAPSNPAQVNSGTILTILSGSAPDYGQFPNDAYSHLMHHARSGLSVKKLSAVQITEGATYTGLVEPEDSLALPGVRYGARFYTIFVSASGTSYSFSCKLDAVQSYNSMSFGNKAWANGGGAAEGNFEFSFDASNGNILIKNKTSTAKTVNVRVHLTTI